MLKINKIALTILISVAATQVQANACNDFVKERQRAIFGNLGSTCASVNTSGSGKTPFTHINPDGGCDLGLSLPGLPSFGMSMGGEFDWCGLAKAVTGSTVNKVNQTMQQKVDGTVSEINRRSQDAIGENAIGGNINIMDRVQREAEDASRGIGGKGGY